MVRDLTHKQVSCLYGEPVSVKRVRNDEMEGVVNETVVNKVVVDVLNIQNQHGRGMFRSGSGWLRKLKGKTQA